MTLGSSPLIAAIELCLGRGRRAHTLAAFCSVRVRAILLLLLLLLLLQLPAQPKEKIQVDGRI
jgi:hypothetical protein